MEGRGWAGWSGVKGGKCDNSNSIINKYIKKTKDEQLSIAECRFRRILLINVNIFSL